MPEFFTSPQGRRLAYEYCPGAGPGVVFLGGFRSDMTGTKAQYLRDRALAQGRAFLRFDYSGHGASDGAFVEGGIGDWAEDAVAVISALTRGPQVLVGSSMGGWMSLLVARAVPDRVAGFVGIAAAPDFTEDSMWDTYDAAQRAELMTGGQIAFQSDYAEEPYPITRRLIEQGRANLVLRGPIRLDVPVRLLLGSADTAVPVGLGQRLFDAIEGADVRFLLVKGVDHRFSEPECLTLIDETIAEVLGRIPA